MLPGRGGIPLSGIGSGNHSCTRKSPGTVPPAMVMMMVCYDACAALEDNVVFFGEEDGDEAVWQEHSEKYGEGDSDPEDHETLLWEDVVSWSCCG